MKMTKHFQAFPKKSRLSLAIIAALSMPLFGAPSAVAQVSRDGIILSPGSSGAGYSLDSASPPNLSLSGSLASTAAAAVSVNGTTIGTLSNTGSISGTNAAIDIGATGAIGTISNTGTIAGDIVNDSSGNLNIVGGTAGGLTTIGTLTGSNGSSPGTITNTGSNVNLSGTLLLNDNINVAGNTVALNYLSSGSILVLSNPVTITGNYTQAASTVLVTRVADNAVATGAGSGYGRLVVNGTATLADGSAVGLLKANAYNFAAGQRFVVVQATTLTVSPSALVYGIISDTGAVVSGSAVADGGYTDLVLTVVSTTSTSTGSASSSTLSPATNGNAKSALRGLGAYGGVSNAALLNLYNASMALNNGTAAEANKAGVRLSPVSQTQAMRAAAAPSLSTLDIVGAHVDGLRLAQSGSSGLSTGEAAPRYGLWGQAFGGHSSQKARDGVDGYASDYGGLLMGLDRNLSDNWRVGGVLSYSNAAIYGTGDATGNATHVNNYGLFAYAGFTAPRWYANLSAGVSAQRYTENRQVDFSGFSGTTNGSFGGTQWVARGELGYPIALGAATLTPLGSLTYAYLQTGSYTESGGNGAALHVGQAHATSVKSDLGVKLEAPFQTRDGVLVPSMQLAWRHELDRARTTVDASFAADPTGNTAFSTQGTRPVSDSGLMTLGLNLLRANNLSITAQYQLQAASGYLSQAGTLRIRQDF